MPDIQKNYPETFSPLLSAQSIKTHAFPCVKRGPALKCEGVSEWLQKGSLCPVVYSGEAKEILAKSKQLSPEEIAHLETPAGKVEFNKEGISLAVDRRVALFFQQAILCYKMSAFTFSAKGADDQIGTSPKLHLASTDNKTLIHKREAAHSSTIPTLIAHAKDGSTPQGFVYLKGGSSHAQHNATIGMNECVNGADELIDGLGADSKLRHTAIKILNRVAGGLDPVKATLEFLESFEKQVIATGKELDDKNASTDPRRLVLAKYQKKIGKIKVAAQDEAFFDNLIGVAIDPANPKEEILRSVVYQKRYDIIRLQEVIESRIGKRIHTFEQSTPAAERSLVEYAILKNFSSTASRQTLEKLFAKTAVIFEEEYNQNVDGTARPNLTQLKGFRTKVAKVAEKHKVALAALLKEINKDFAELRAAELSYRSGVFRDLRTKVNQWTQQQFCMHYNTTTGQTVSRSWVSRMEHLAKANHRDPATYMTPINQRRRFVSLSDAKRCADTFGVSVGMFLPSVFTSAA